MLTHPHVLPETHRTKNTCTDKATNFSLLVEYQWSSPQHTSLTHVGPDLAGRTIVVCLYKCSVVPIVPDFRVACILSLLKLSTTELNGSTNQSYATLSQLIEQNIMDIRKYLGK